MIEFTSTFPVFVVENLESLKTFYQQQFGFDTVFFEAGFYLHLVHPVNGVQLGFMLPNLDNQPSFLQAQALTDGMVISFEVADAATAHRIAKDAGLDIIFALKDEAWGQRHFMLRDPAGLVIDIVQDTSR